MKPNCTKNNGAIRDELSRVVGHNTKPEAWWDTQSGQEASPLSGPSGGEKLEPEDKAWWHVADVRFESTVDRVPQRSQGPDLSLLPTGLMGVGGRISAAKGTNLGQAKR